MYALRWYALLLLILGCEPSATQSLLPGGLDAHSGGPAATDATPVGDTAAAAQGPEYGRLGELLATRGELVPTALRATLTALVADAASAQKAGDRCGESKALDAFVKALQGVTEDPPSLVTQLTVLARSGSRAAARAAKAAGKPCAGSELLDTALGEKRFAPTLTTAKVQLTFPPADLRLHWIGQRPFARVTVAGADARYDTWGVPDVPLRRLAFVVPEGATLKLVTRNLKVREKLKVDLAPVREGLAVGDPLFFPPPEELFDKARYGTEGLFPEQPCRLDEAGRFRGVRMAIATCAAAQLDRSKRTLSLLAGYELEVSFSGGKTWGSALVRSGLDDLSALEALAVNGSLLRTAPLAPWTWAPWLPSVIVVPGRGACEQERGDLGEEVLIFAPAALRDSADALANLRSKQGGLAARVVDVFPSDTAETLDAIVEARFATCPIRPRFVVLFGDSDLVPPHKFVLDTGPDPYPLDGDNPVSDQLLAHVGPVDAFPDLMVGRIPTSSPSVAAAYIEHLERWQRAATTADPSYFTRAGLIGGFECCAEGDDVPPGQEAHGFTQELRPIANALRAGNFELQVALKRHGDDDVPTTSSDGVPLWEPVRREDNYPWDAANVDDVARIFAKGTSLLVYADHGSPDAWSAPYVPTTELFRLTTTGFSPFIVNFTCLANHFDDELNPGVYYAEASQTHLGEALSLGSSARAPAVAVVGYTRVARGGPASVSGQGVADALVPSVLADFGPTAPAKTAGEATLWGHLRATMVYRTETETLADRLVSRGGFWENHVMFAHLGDPSAPLIRRHVDALAAQAMTPTSVPSSGPGLYTTAAWQASQEAGAAVIVGPEDVDPTDYDASPAAPVVVTWLEGGLTVLGPPDGSTVVAVHLDGNDSTARQRVVVGAAAVTAGRADVTFIPPFATTFGASVNVELITPDNEVHVLRQVVASVFPLLGTGAFEDATINDLEHWVAPAAPPSDRFGFAVVQGGDYELIASSDPGALGIAGQGVRIADPSPDGADNVRFYFEDNALDGDDVRRFGLRIAVSGGAALSPVNVRLELAGAAGEQSLVIPVLRGQPFFVGAGLDSGIRIATLEVLGNGDLQLDDVRFE